MSGWSSWESLQIISYQLPHQSVYISPKRRRKHIITHSLGSRDPLGNHLIVGNPWIPNLLHTDLWSSQSTCNRKHSNHHQITLHQRRFTDAKHDWALLTTEVSRNLLPDTDIHIIKIAVSTPRDWNGRVELWKIHKNRLIITTINDDNWQMGIPTLAITTPFCPLRASPSFSYSGANLLQCPHLQNINNTNNQWSLSFTTSMK